LAAAIRADNLPWNPAVIALLPFPSILNMMARDMNWTQQLGTAVLNQRAGVMDAVQRLRRQAYNYGYLQSNPYVYVRDVGATSQLSPSTLNISMFQSTTRRSYSSRPVLDLRLLGPYALVRRSSWEQPSTPGAGLRLVSCGDATTSSSTTLPGTGYGSIVGSTCIRMRTSGSDHLDPSVILKFTECPSGTNMTTARYNHRSCRY
jgi:Protein of unknown function (DUF3300)